MTFVKLPRGGKCPATSLAWDTENERNNCTGVTRYHCLRNEWGKLGTTCLDPSWIQAGYCPEYNVAASKLDAAKCNKTNGVCPTKTIFSNDVIAYSACLYTEDTEDFAGDNTSFDKKNPDRNNAESDINKTLVVGVPLIVIAIIVAVITVIFFYRRKQQKRKKSSPKDRKMTDEESLIQSSEKKNCDDLQAPIPDFAPIPEIEEHLKKINKGRPVELLCKKKAEDLLLSKGWIVVVGPPGSGKTTLGLDILSSKHNQMEDGKKCRVILATSIKDEVQHDLNFNHRNYLLLDNFYEKWLDMQKNIIDEDLRKLKTWHTKFFNVSREKRHIFAIIILSRSSWKFIYKDIRYHPLFDESYIVDLEKENVSIAQRMEIFTNELGEHISTEQIDGRDIKCFKLSSSEGREIGIPETIQLLHLHHEFGTNAKSFYENPGQRLEEHFTKMKSSPDDSIRLKYCALLYLLLKGGEIDIEKEEDQELKRKLTKRFKLKSEELSASTMILSSQFAIKRHDKKLTFQHEIVMTHFMREFVTKSVTVSNKDSNAAFFIETCHPRLLLRYTRTRKTSTEPLEDFKGLKTELYEVLVRRLVDHHFQTGEDLSQHILMTDKDFKKKYEKRILSNKVKI